MEDLNQCFLVVLIGAGLLLDFWLFCSVGLAHVIGSMTLRPTL